MYPSPIKLDLILLENGASPKKYDIILIINKLNVKCLKSKIYVQKYMDFISIKRIAY